MRNLSPVSSNRRPTSFRALSFLAALCVVLSLAMLVEPLAAQDDCKVRRFGGPNRFSATPVDTVPELQKMFSEHRADIMTLLAQVGWEGDADDLFAAVSAGRMTEGMYEKGTFFNWMGFREKGAPSAKTNTCWGGARPFEAWTLNFESNGRRWFFAVPKVCGNITLLGSEELPKANPPICKIEARCNQDGQFVVSSAGSQGTSGISVISPSGKTSSYSSPFEPSEEGSYRFVVESARDGLTCKEEVERAACPPPKLACRVEVVPEVAARDEVTIRVVGEPASRVQNVSVSVVRDDETEARVSESLDAPFSWTGVFKKPGTYAITASATGDGQPSDQCTGTLAVTGPDTRWVWRLFPAFGDGDDSQLQSFSDVDRRQLTLDAGRGFGTGLEYLALPWLGLEASALVLEQDAHFVFDTATVWGMDDDTAQTILLSVGPNFHLTPDSKVDFYVGPFLGYAFRDDFTFRDQGATYRYGLDDDFAFGAQLGLDVPVCMSGRCWTFHSGLRYLDLDDDVEELGFSDPSAGLGIPRSDFDLGFDDLILTLGAGYRF